MKVTKDIVQERGREKEMRKGKENGGEVNEWSESKTEKEKISDHQVRRSYHWSAAPLKQLSLSPKWVILVGEPEEEKEIALSEGSHSC